MVRIDPMTTRSPSAPWTLLAASVAVAAVTAAISIGSERDAHAASIIKDPNPPKYSVEIEPKLNLSYFGAWNYGGNAWGPGVRFTIPVMSPGFIKTINDSIGISFGLDALKYQGYNYYYGCDPRRCPGFYYYDTSFWSIHIPIAMQWNFWLTDKWSVFGEVGGTLRKSFYHDDPYIASCDPRFYDCRSRSSTDFYFTFFAGGRFHFSDSLALTVRIGHPIDFSVGLSIFL